MNASDGAGKRSGTARWAGLLFWLVVTFCAPLIGTFFGMPDDWYASLKKPSWNPPSWVFGPVWTLLYAMMATAAWLVWCEGGWKMRKRELGLYVGQLVLNAAWSPLFFGFHRPDWALIDILVLISSVVLMLAVFARVRRLAGLLLIPYLLWLTFATVLNGTLWWLNRGPGFPLD